jgi:hypothetical protein
MVNRYIVASLKAQPDYATRLPGGVHNAVAPDRTAYPFLVFAHSGGNDTNAFSVGIVGAGMSYLLKITDKSESDAIASSVAEWMENALHANNGLSIGGGWVYCQKENPFNLPTLEEDVKFQQVGGTFRFWADRP